MEAFHANQRSNLFLAQGPNVLCTVLAGKRSGSCPVVSVSAHAIIFEAAQALSIL